MQHLRRLFCCLVVTLISTALFAQQTGSISGKVTASDKSALPGVTVEARSNVLPQPRVTTTEANGDYALPALIPGKYTVTYTLSGMQTVTRNVDVLLRQVAEVDVTLGVAGVSETITVTAEQTLVSKESTALQSGLTSQQIESLPLTQDYRDLQKFIPGVMVTEDQFRGPSAGGSGQDNVYLFDGVNITMPLFGIMNQDPNNHDIAQVTYIRGGAKAVDFDRAGGFQIDSVSKSGTNKFSGELSYQVRRHNFSSGRLATSNRTYDEDRSWSTVNLGGPIVSDQLFFYGSFYRPIFKRINQANLYGTLPEYDKKRNEEFGKLTYTPLQSWLINGSYRHSHTIENSGDDFSTNRAPTTGTGSEGYLKLGVLESSYVINPKSLATFKFTDYRNPGVGSSDFVSNAVVSTTPGAHLDIGNLGTQGRLNVPSTIPGNTPVNNFVQPYINQYGYPCSDPSGHCGGGIVGFGRYARDDDSFYRKGGQAGYNYTFGTNISHDLHVGIQRNKDSEDRFQVSNGWGLIDIPGGVGTTGLVCNPPACATATPAFFIATFNQQGARNFPAIHSEFTSTNIELNDTIHAGNWSFNIGVMDSKDTLYGQGLATADNLAGFVASPGTKYKMHEFGFTEMIQPRFGTTWAYNGRDTVYASYALYYPPANSDARAASWDRGLNSEIKAYFDQNGTLLGVDPNAASAGKWWQEGIKHPEIAEYMLGTARQLSQGWSARVYTRYRKGGHFIEDTNNTARVAFNPPPGVSQTPYVPNLADINKAIGSSTSYVIANLDGAFTKYYEATAESEWHSKALTLSGSYTWSHYYGNFDQDSSATCPTCNDAGVFIGSSNIGDGAGRQLWNFKYGDLRGDRRNLVKFSGTYALPWNASTGAFYYYQSGQPWQLESVLPYRALTGSTSDANRYAEPAGSRRTQGHQQFDLNYTQNIPLTRGIQLQLLGNIFNIFNKQEGYNFEDRIGTLGFTTRTDVPTIPIPDSIPQSVRDQLKLDPNARVNAPYPTSYYAPRRFELAARISF